MNHRVPKTGDSTRWDAKKNKFSGGQKHSTPPKISVGNLKCFVTPQSVGFAILLGMC